MIPQVIFVCFKSLSATSPSFKGNRSITITFCLSDDFGSDEDNDFGEEEEEDGGSDYEAKKGKKVKKGKVEKPGKRSLKRKRDSGRLQM